MRIKRYRGASLQDALAKVKADLGPEAVLLSNRNLGPGEAGPKEKVEVTAARDGQAGLDASARTDARRPSDYLGRIQEDLAHLRALMTINASKNNLTALCQGNTELQLFFERLTAAGVDESLALDLIDKVGSRIDRRTAPETARAELISQLREAVPTAPENDRGPIRWALVGPTGGGKTTTLAKLAARFAIEQGKSTALITVDNYRLGAAEQLGAYARLLGAPLTVAFNREELRSAMDAYRDKDVILLDTAGRSPNHLINMNELKMLMREVEGLRKWLVLPASVKDRDMADAVRSFGEVGLHGLIFTKLDETGSYGEIINQILRYRLPVGYISAGQRVPEDIEPATRERLLRLVLNGSDGVKEYTHDH